MYIRIYKKINSSASMKLRKAYRKIDFFSKRNNSNFLFMGDGHIDEIINGLKSHGYNENNPLIVDFVKLSHHGSRKNISTEFLSIIKSNLMNQATS